ncbi:hypothetical protein HND25_23785 [Rhodococcus erythropolis]|nr:hypothetical protein [Rhodococcus erythropolis]MBO8149461.1 hypothetical protein [Rhodococcus erythropolis]MDO1491611.1 hypothetical protein [Rhodococcus erythropolis]GCB57597.1 hypothetical protein rerp_40050 [Rhodococcus erythropolis]
MRVTGGVVLSVTAKPGAEEMYNWDLQNQIVAFVDSLRPMAGYYHDMYYGSLYAFADQQSHLLTLLGFPPVP